MTEGDSEALRQIGIGAVHERGVEFGWRWVPELWLSLRSVVGFRVSVFAGLLFGWTEHSDTGR